MFNFLTKFLFSWKKPPIVIVTGQARRAAAEAISKVLRPKIKQVLVKQAEPGKLADFSFFVQKSKKPILVVTDITEIPFEQEFLTGEKEKTNEIRNLARVFPLSGHLVLNLDNKTIREIKEESQAPCLSFGFQEGADFRVSDVKLNHGINFKVNYQGNSVPFWLESVFAKEQIYSALAAAAVGTLFDLNLVEISQALAVN